MSDASRPANGSAPKKHKHRWLYPMTGAVAGLVRRCSRCDVVQRYKAWRPA